MRGGTGFLERPAVQRALRQLRSSSVPLGTALADLEAGMDEAVPHLDVDELDPDDHEARAEAAAKAKDEHDAMALLVRMGRDYLRLDPVGGGATFAAWLAATIHSEAEAAHGGDAVDVATFHAAKGLEWAIVHLAGIEDGYVPIAHAKTAAARAEEARLLYVAMTRAQRELRITFAEQRTFAGRVVDRRRSPLLSPLPDRPPAPEVPDGVANPPVEGWADELARQRATLRRTRAAASPELEALRRWRHVVARAARVDPEAVLPDHVLARVVAAHPRDLTALGAVRGVGAILADRLGPDLLMALDGAAPEEVGT
jgi:DNA helicase-2/ATP-dependent DNA helicase PcrA